MEKFWKNIKSFFSNKTISASNFILYENDEIIRNEGEVAKKFNTYVSNVVQNLNIKEVENSVLISEHIEDPIFKAIYKYSKHQSIIAINENCASEIKFSFNTATPLDVLDVINGIDVPKATTNKNIPSKTFKQDIDLYLDIITNMFNNSITECNFPDMLKPVDITPAFKKGDVTDKSNYMPISLLPLKNYFLYKLACIWNNISLNTYAALEKV